MVAEVPLEARPVSTGEVRPLGQARPMAYVSRLSGNTITYLVIDINQATESTVTAIGSIPDPLSAVSTNLVDRDELSLR
jgi:hypothetical protein